MFDIQINGKAIRKYSHQGNYYVEGRTGTEYSIKITNNYYSRRLFVVSVDGMNVISGKTADEDPHNGYIVNGYDTLNLKGFRINNDEVAAFKFVDSKKSYAKEVTDSKENNGVIGVRVFDEKIYQPTYNYNWTQEKGNYYDPTTPPWKSSPIWMNHDNMPMYGSSCDDVYKGDMLSLSDDSSSDTMKCCSYSSNVLRSADAKPAEFNLGTGWGGKQVQKVQEVAFEVGTLVNTDLVYYATKDQLEKMGVDMGSTKKIRTMTSAFGEKKYCPIPRGWKG